MKKLYFVRHGLSEMNKAGMRSGRTDTPLAPEGIEQARQAGALAKNLRIDLIVSSPLKRAHHTARIIATEIGYPLDEIVVDELLVERDFGELEGTVFSPGQLLAEARDVESIEALTTRAKHALERLHALPHQHILVVSHASFGRALRHHLDPTRPFQNAARPEDHFPNATIVELI